MDLISLKAIVLMLIAAAFGDDSWEELFSVENREDLRLDVHSEIPGSIIWKPANTTKITAKAKIYNVDTKTTSVRLPTSSCNIKTKIEDDKVTLKIFPEIQKPTAVNYQHNGGFPLMYSFILTLCIMTSVHGWKTALTYGVLLSGMFVFADMCFSNITRIDIVIEHPEKVSLRKVTLFMKDGNVTLPNTVSPQATVTCSTDNNRNGTGCSSCCHGHGVCGIGDRCYCDKGYDEKTHCKMKIIPQHTLYINPVDRRIMHVRVPVNLNITAYGRRDGNGHIKSLKSFRSRDQYGRSLSILMGKLRKISKVISSSGTTLTFEWRNKCNVHVTVLFNKGQGQIDQDVILCKNKLKTTENTHKDDQVLNVLPSTRNGETLNRSYQRLKHQSTEFIKIPVEVKSCNEPDSSAAISATVASSNSTKTQNTNEYIGFTSMYPGLYHIKLPVKPVLFNSDLETTVCSSLIRTTSHICKYVTSNYNKFQRHICKSIRNSMKVMSEMTYSQIADVTSTCDSSFQTMISFCHEYYIDIQDSCNQDNIIFYDSFIPGNISVDIKATFPGNYSVYSDRFYLQVKENFPFSAGVKMINDIRPKPRFIGFSVNPRDPQPFERYQVKIDYACASTTTKLDMKIEGSDNYHNNVTCIGMTPCNCCVLHVAGGAGLVMDKVHVALNDPLTQTVTTREIAVLF